MYRKFLKNFAAVSVILLILAAGLVVLFDPFFHYHEPVGPLKAVLTKKEYPIYSPRLLYQSGLDA